MSNIHKDSYKEDIRIIHTADWHLGCELYKKNELYEDFFRSVEYLYTFIKNSNPKPDFLVHSGDMFHNPRVDSNTRLNCYKLLKKFSLPIYVIRGNHDGSMLADREGENCILDELHELGLINYIRFSVFNDKSSGINIYGVGGYKSNSINKIYELVKRYPLNQKKINILLTHTFTDDYHEIIPPQQLLEIGFTMINIGHVHDKDFLGGNIFCPGSTNYVSANEWPKDSLKQNKFFKFFYDIRISKKDQKITHFPIEIPVRHCSKQEILFTDSNPEDINQKMKKVVIGNNIKGGLLRLELKGNLISGSKEEIKCEKIKQFGNKLLGIEIKNHINTNSLTEDIDIEEYDVILRKIIENSHNKKEIPAIETSINKIVEITSRRKKLIEKDSQEIKDIIKSLITNRGKL